MSCTWAGRMCLGTLVTQIPKIIIVHTLSYIRLPPRYLPVPAFDPIRIDRPVI